MATMLNPRVRSVKLYGLTQPELKRLLTKLKSRKFAAKEFAVDVEEVETCPERVTFHRNKRLSAVPPGPYFNVLVEYY